jgi:AbrB family looped-hinge helix DNA binding protein
VVSVSTQTGVAKTSLSHYRITVFRNTEGEMLVSTLTTKYQATIPKMVREALQLEAGDRVEFLIAGSGEVAIRKAPPRDTELLALEATLSPEWDSTADDDAYAGL